VDGGICKTYVAGGHSHLKKTQTGENFLICQKARTREEIVASDRTNDVEAKEPVPTGAILDVAFIMVLVVLGVFVLGLVGACSAVAFYQRQRSTQPSTQPLQISNEDDRENYALGEHRWDFFISYTQRDETAKLLAESLWAEFRAIGKRVWLDVKMMRCDEEAMKDGVLNSAVFLSVVTDNGECSYFSREYCRSEISWAQSELKTIVAVIAADDKSRVHDLIANGQEHGVDYSNLNFMHFDRSGPAYTAASLRSICRASGQECHIDEAYQAASSVSH
jgi:hypothetical protein